MGGLVPPPQSGGKYRRNLPGRKIGTTFLTGVGFNMLTPPPHPYGYWGEEGKKRAVWAKGRQARSASGIACDLNVWRLDAYGAPIKWDDYGNRDSVYGWEIDHIIPSAKGGSDYISNLRPLQWRNNASRGGKLSNR